MGDNKPDETRIDNHFIMINATYFEGYMFSDIVRKTQANPDEETPPEYYIVIKSKEDDSALACTNKDKTRTSLAGKKLFGKSKTEFWE